MSDDDLIRQAISKYLQAYESRDAAGCAAIYSADAFVVSPWGPPVRGRDAIKGAHLEWFEDGETNKSMLVEELEISGDLAICLIRYGADVPGPEGKPERAYGCSLNTLRRQPDGDWKICHTSLNELGDFETGFSK